MASFFEKKWINYLDVASENDSDSGAFIPYPIQFANSIRLANNDVVYIFDEVGSGKTISAGIMALNYLEQKEQVPGAEKKVLVITTNALVKSGQFLADWMDKLPFRKLGYENEIEVVNQQYTSFKNEKKYGLVIIDEAHMFLNLETERTQNLMNNVRAEKVVFMTATPIKEGINDLYHYVRIADCITGKENNREWIDTVVNQGDIICSRFDLTLPVSRYFKDTIQSLVDEKYQKTAAIRQFPQVWKYGGNRTYSYPDLKEKYGVQAATLMEEVLKREDDLFIVFVRFVESQAKMLYKAAREYFEVYNKDTGKNYRAEMVTGEDPKEKLRKYETLRPEECPKMLILTYQIAEQGVNLRTFNSIVNYHISAFPAALEQRFGRVDRGSSVHEKIYVYYLISGGVTWWDINTLNYYRAVHTFLHSLLSGLPSRNAVITKETVEELGNEEIYEKSLTALKKCEELLENGSVVEKIICSLIEGEKTELSDDEEVLKCLLEDNEILSDDAKQVCSDGKKLIATIESELKSRGLSEEEKDLAAAIVEKLNMGDKIFYKKSDGNLCIADAVEDCAKAMKEKECYLGYVAEFEEKIAFPICVQKYSKIISEKYEKAFSENRFNDIFTFGQDDGRLEKILDELAVPEKALLMSDPSAVIAALPFMKMCELFKRFLQGQVRTPGGYIKKDFDETDNPFTGAMKEIAREVKEGTLKGALSKEFEDRYFPENADYNSYFRMEMKEIPETKLQYLEASEWLKLAYWYTRREEIYFDFESRWLFDMQYNILKGEKLKPDMNQYFTWDTYKDARWGNNPFYKREQQWIAAYVSGAEIKEVICVPKRDMYRSLFGLYVKYPVKEDYRDYVKQTGMFEVLQKNEKWSELPVDAKDYWTRGILYELWGITKPYDLWKIIFPKFPRSKEDARDVVYDPMTKSEVKDIERRHGVNLLS